MFGPAHWMDTLLVSAVSQAERREHRDTAALGEAEIEGEISQSRERVRRVVRRGAGVCVCVFATCVCVAFGRLQWLESVCIFLGVWYFENDVLLQRRWREIKIKP